MPAASLNIQGCHLVVLYPDCLKLDAVFEGIEGLLLCQQLFCKVNPSTESENPLA